jgi:hypothetical protein
MCNEEVTLSNIRQIFIENILSKNISKSAKKRGFRPHLFDVLAVYI